MSRENDTSSVDKAIEENLKRAFDDMANEPLPSRFADLLDALKKTNAASDPDKSDDT